MGSSEHFPGPALPTWIGTRPASTGLQLPSRVGKALFCTPLSRPGSSMHAHSQALTFRSSASLVRDCHFPAESDWEYWMALQCPDPSLWRMSFKTKKSVSFGVEMVREFTLPCTFVKLRQKSPSTDLRPHPKSHGGPKLVVPNRQQSRSFAPPKASLSLLRWPEDTQGPPVGLSPSTGPETVCKSQGMKSEKQPLSG